MPSGIFQCFVHRLICTVVNVRDVSRSRISRLPHPLRVTLQANRKRGSHSLFIFFFFLLNPVSTLLDSVICDSTPFPALILLYYTNASPIGDKSDLL